MTFVGMPRVVWGVCGIHVRIAVGLEGVCTATGANECALKVCAQALIEPNAVINAVTAFVLTVLITTIAMLTTSTFST